MKKWGAAARRGLAEIRQGTMTSRSRAGTAAEGRGPRKRDAVWARNPPAPNSMNDMILQVCGLRWHGPISVVGAPIRSDGYGVVATPRI